MRHKIDASNILGVISTIWKILAGVALVAATAGAHSNDKYLPLAVGNTWVYRVSNRSITNAYSTESVVRAQQVQNETWYVIQTVPGGREQFWRWDEDGRLLRLNDATSKPQLVLDPNAFADTLAQLPIVARGIPAVTPFGEFKDTLDYRTPIALDQFSGRFAKGLGRVSESVYLIAGSSGGLSSLRELQEAVIGRKHFQASQPSMSISVEATRFDVTNKKATNCKVPCYFVACGIAGADLPDAYKPCFQGRTAFTLPASAADVEAWIDLYNEQGKSVMTIKAPVPKGNPGESILYWRIPLYTGNGVLLPVGSYAVLAHIISGGDDIAVAWTRVVVE